MRVASRALRSARRRLDAPLYDADTHPHRTPDPELLLEQRRAREDLDSVLAEMPLDLRAAFVLFEIEGCSQPEIAEALRVPKGTVASRLRRARADFARRARRHGLIDDEGGLP
jgi:RNA polymerase sigma-70 factor (ECF subfamily)